MLKAVIIDDEPKAIQSLTWELSHFENDIEIIASFTEPEKAISYINKTDFDCLFLDIEMPTMDGFQLLENVINNNFVVVITTAYNEYAIKALKEEAIDYLLKPVDTDDLKLTLFKIKNYNSKHYYSEKFERVLLQFNDATRQKKITINTDGKLIFLEPCDIIYVESDGNYSTIFLNNKAKQKLVVTKKLKEIKALLPDNYFFRIHNSFIINLNKVKEFIKSEGYVILEDNYKIPVSRQKKNELLEKL